VANVQVIEAIKVLAGRGELVSRTLLEMDPWNGARRRIDLQQAKDPDCPCCGLRRFEFLDGVRGRGAGGEAALCGRDAVQVCVGGAGLDLLELGERLSRVGRVQTTAWFVRARVDDRHELTVFRDGRAIVKGTSDVGRARSLYARYVGV
jgi:adenylyltransferase/sulfurtransferase